MNNKQNVPTVRFLGFDQDWKEKELGKDICEIMGGGTPSTSIPEFWGGDIDWYSPTEIGKRVYVEGSQKKITPLGLKCSSAKILPAGKTVLFTSRAGIGDMAILNNSGTTNQGFQSFVVKDGYSPYFLYSAGHLIKGYALKHASGSTFLEISGKQLAQMMIFAPSSDEQTQIGNYFQKLDTLINQHQQKHDKLSNLKKAMLEKMFPKAGETVPEIRFDGFSGDWEEKELGRDIAEIVGGGTPSTSVSDFWDGDIDWYSPTEIGKRVYAEGSQKKITRLGLKSSSAKILPAGKTVLFTSRAGIGDMAILTKSGTTNQGFQSFVCKDGYSPYFLYSAGHLIKAYALKHASGSTFLEISGKQLAQMILLVPSSDEQNQIGDYFKKLDELINQHSQQITKLKNIKQACLDKMFV